MVPAVNADSLHWKQSTLMRSWLMLALVSKVANMLSSSSGGHFMGKDAAMAICCRWEKSSLFGAYSAPYRA